MNLPIVFGILNCISYRLERHDMFDMIPILFDSTLMIARPTPLDMDFGLLIRPYRREAWVMVGVTVAAIFAFLIVPGFFLPKFSSYTRYAKVFINSRFTKTILYFHTFLQHL